MSEDKRELIDRLYRRDAEYCGVVNEFGEGAREIARLRAINDELVGALEKIIHHFADVMSGPFLAGVTFKNGVEGIPIIAAARTALTKAKEETQ